MNKQLKTARNAAGERVILGRGIEWTDYTWNVIGGCEHDCEWVMPDGTVAECYAKTVAERLATKAYDQGFKHHYFWPEKLNQPLGAPAGAKIFLDSMSDLFGHWVPEGQIEQVLDVVRARPDVHFQSLTKNAPRLLKFDLPANLWVGVSAPPSIFKGKVLNLDQKRALVRKQLDVLKEVRRRQAMTATSLQTRVTWMSIEPLSFDIAAMFDEWCVSGGNLPLNWAVIGAASKGAKLFQPAFEDTRRCHDVLRDHGVAVFHKGNLEWQPHREEWPVFGAGFKTGTVLSMPAPDFIKSSNLSGQKYLAATIDEWTAVDAKSKPHGDDCDCSACCPN